MIQQESYHFKGNKEEIVNGILSLLLSKEHYQELSLYSYFINESQPEQYRQKIGAILEEMQKDSLILIRENASNDFRKPIQIIDSDKKPVEFNSESALVYLRQYGKKVIMEGGIKKIAKQKLFINGLNF